MNFLTNYAMDTIFGTILYHNLIYHNLIYSELWLVRMCHVPTWPTDITLLIRTHHLTNYGIKLYKKLCSKHNSFFNFLFTCFHFSFGPTPQNFFSSFLSHSRVPLSCLILSSFYLFIIFYKLFSLVLSINKSQYSYIQNFILTVDSKWYL